MKKKLLPILICFALITTLSARVIAAETKQGNQIANDYDALISDPFANDPFFQSQNDAFRQMYKMQQTMDQFFKNQLSQMRNSLINQANPNVFSNTTNIQIEENKNELIYKIKLPQGTDSKVDASVKNGQLVVSTNVTQKITRDQENNKSVSYSQSNYSQSFQLPGGYDPNSMATKMQDSNLIVTFKKSLLTSSTPKRLGSQKI